MSSLHGLNTEALLTNATCTDHLRLFNLSWKGKVYLRRPLTDLGHCESQCCTFVNTWHHNSKVTWRSRRLKSSTTWLLFSTGCWGSRADLEGGAPGARQFSNPFAPPLTTNPGSALLRLTTKKISKLRITATVTRWQVCKMVENVNLFLGLTIPHEPRIVVMPTFSSMVTPGVTTTTGPVATNDHKVGIKKTLGFQCQRVKRSPKWCFAWTTPNATGLSHAITSNT